MNILAFIVHKKTSNLRLPQRALPNDPRVDMSDLFTPHTLETASDAGRVILQDIQQGYGFIPNLFHYMIEAPVVVEAYLMLNKLIARTSLTPAQAQLALLTVSVENGCAFCTAAHQGLAKKSGVKMASIASVVAKSVPVCAQDAALVGFVQQLVIERGRVTDAVVLDFLAAGHTKQHVFELMLILAIKTLSNYTNHLTHPLPNPEFAQMLS